MRPKVWRWKQLLFCSIRHSLFQSFQHAIDSLRSAGSAMFMLYSQIWQSRRYIRRLEEILNNNIVNHFNLKTNIENYSCMINFNIFPSVYCKLIALTIFGDQRHYPENPHISYGIRSEIWSQFQTRSVCSECLLCVKCKYNSRRCSGIPLDSSPTNDKEVAL